MHPIPLDTVHCSPVIFSFWQQYQVLCMDADDLHEVPVLTDMETQPKHNTLAWCSHLLRQMPSHPSRPSAILIQFLLDRNSCSLCLCFLSGSLLMKKKSPSFSLYRDEKTSRYHSISRQPSALPSIFYNGNTRRQLLRLYIMTFPCRCSKVSSTVISCCLSPTGSSLKLSPAYYSLSLQFFSLFLQYHSKKGGLSTPSFFQNS